MGKYDHTCFGCKHADISPNSHENMNGSRREIRCAEYHQYVEPFGEGLRCKGYSNGYYSDSYIEKCVETFNKWCNYYIISACAGIIDMPNASAYLDAFKEFKTEDINKVEVVSLLQGFGFTPETLLEDYDVYGRAVADAMYAAHENPESKDACETHIKTSILPELDKLFEYKNSGRSTRALIGYILLTRKLMNFYGIEYTPIKVEANVNDDEPLAQGAR